MLGGPLNGSWQNKYDFGLDLKQYLTNSSCLVQNIRELHETTTNHESFIVQQSQRSTLKNASGEGDMYRKPKYEGQMKGYCTAIKRLW